MALRIVSYNIRKAVGLDWRRHPHRILDVVNGLAPDVVVLQEADRRLGARPSAIPHHLLETETDLAPVDLAINDVSLGWHGNAILVRRDIRVDTCDRIELPGLEPRGAVVAHLTTGVGHIVVVGVHLALLRAWRRRQLAAIRRQLNDAAAAVSVLAGDFNEWSPDLGLEPLSGDYEVVAPGLTFHAGRPAAALDRFAHGRRLRVLSSGVDTSFQARQSSDHLPIWIDLDLLPEGG